MKRKNILSLAALMIAVCMVLCSCGSKPDPAIANYEQQIAALQQENEALKNQVEVLTNQLQSVQTAVLTDWTLTAKASADRDFAIIEFSAVPANLADGQTLNLIVTLNGFEAESIQCQPEGERYTATLELPAADGYSYYCLLMDPESNQQQQIPLVTLENGVNDSLVNLDTSLNAYCNLFIESWKAAGGKLTVEAGFAQAQLPTISTGGEDVSISKCELVFLHNGEVLGREALTLSEGESENSYESAVSGISFELPKLEEDHQFDLQLVVALSDGSEVVYNGCSWYVTGGELNPVMG